MDLEKLPLLSLKILTKSMILISIIQRIFLPKLKNRDKGIKLLQQKRLQPRLKPPFSRYLFNQSKTYILIFLAMRID